MIDSAAVPLCLPHSMITLPTFHISHITPVSLVPPSDPPPPPRFIDSVPVHTVKRLLAVHRRGRCRQYLVDWEGYWPEERAWVLARQILDKTLISDFHILQPDIPGTSRDIPWGGGVL